MLDAAAWHGSGIQENVIAIPTSAKVKPGQKKSRKSTDVKNTNSKLVFTLTTSKLSAKDQEF